jgi:hypothetical protein
MARLSFNISRDFEKKFANLSVGIIRDLQKGFSSLRDDIGKNIDDSVDGFSDLLGANITDTQAAELGIGDNGSIDRVKINNAWRQLLSKPLGLSSSERPTVFSVTKLRSKTGIGTIRITMDENKLYNAPLSIVETESEINEPGFSDNVIPWLLWFVKGKSIGAYQFTSDPKRRANIGASRTGKGIMIKGGFWQFPQGENPFPFIQRAIEDLVVSTVEKYIERQL